MNEKEVKEKLNKSEEQNNLNSKRILDLEQELESKLKEITKHSNVMKELEKKYNKCEQQLKSREQEVNELNKNIEEQQVVINGLRRERGIDEKVVEMMSMNKELKIEFKKNFGSLENKINVIMYQISNLSEEVTKLKKSNHNSLEFNTKVENKIDRIREIDFKTEMESDLKVKSIPNQDREDETRSETTFRFKIENFSQLSGITSSPPTFVDNLPWHIMAEPFITKLENRQTYKSLGFYLRCHIKSCNSSCYAKAELRIISQKEGIENMSRKIQHIFDYYRNNWGFNNFMPWNNILNQEKGYIKDNAIILEVWVSAEPPHGV